MFELYHLDYVFEFRVSTLSFVLCIFNFAFEMLLYYVMLSNDWRTEPY